MAAFSKWDDRAVVLAFVVIVAGTVLYDAAHPWFWQRAHDTAPVAALLILGVLIALVRRHRWAWWVCLVASLIGLPTWIINRLLDRRTAGGIAGLVIGLIELALLLSPQMRRYVYTDRAVVRSA